MQGDFIRTRSIQWDSSWPRLLSQDERYAILHYLEEDFGIPPAVFIPYIFFKSSRAYYMVRQHPCLHEICNLKIQNAGLPAIRILGRHLKPTTQFAQLFGPMATKRVLRLEWDDMKNLAKVGEIRLKKRLANGFYLLNSHEFFWGVSLVKEGERLISYLSKQMKSALLS